MKVLILMFALTFTLFAGRGDNFNRTDCADDVIEVNVSSGDVSIDEGARGIYVDTAGVIKVRVQPRGGNGVQRDVILTFDGAGYLPIQVIKVYRYLTGTTPATTKIILAADASSVVGVKVLK
jgi:hypothetical protein